ncbi:branched-chain amino acid ABC transporter permease [Truepera radiovictrix]|uniref:Inner-membrane translocator n=1 Tax=Truepera radiovictrix (strain DSM 17093 / CIP 108686 / LMG 22925 / RQ-24) TaxID=649638 RepID=D7CSP8_TRURR|nr:branched-chain amino acid ABC transporter permease [Truepera radiovictrix]ADI15468.1 inner-membrane translocator [Truepera radiovictrix DSM 17093]WMT55981.1 branched-chain amino acid ABC transporter permease [Truepera radiovictrix]
MIYFLQLLLTGVAVGCIYALAALGFVLIYKSSRVINFAHGELIAIGAFAVFGLTVWAGLNIWLALALALALMFFLGRGIERLFLRPMVGEPIISVIMVTIGLASLLSGLVYFTPFGTLTARYPNFLPQVPLRFNVAGGTLILRWEQALAILFTLVFIALLMWFFKRSTLGIAMRAVADDQLASLSVGVSVERVFGLAWAAAGLSATAAGFIVGGLYGLEFSGLTAVGLRVFPAVILGGLDSIAGAVVGGILIGVLEQLSSGYLDTYVPGGGTGEVFPFIVLLLILLIKPHGLFGTEEIERV